MADTVRLGIIGIGGMGGSHAQSAAYVKSLRVAAVCDTNRDKADAVAQTYSCAAFYDHTSLLQSGVIDAVLIATPHYSHTTIGIDALTAGLHVLVEKPISVHKADCERLIAAHTDPSRVFAAMFNQRTDPYYRKVKEIIDAGELGEITRVNWIITTWFRTELYYASGDWRATWAGEGGGVLLNQCPHQLDLLQWLCGMPVRVRAFCGIGKHHDIEVEDEVTAYLEYENGATGVFVTSTGEAPGSNRLEICGDRGRIIVDDNSLTFLRNCTGQREFCRTSTERFAKPDVWNISIPVGGHGGQHQEILQNFTDAILGGKPLIAPASEGIRSVELGNAMLYSSELAETVMLPLDAAAYEAMLKKKIAASRYSRRKRTVEVIDDLGKSFL